MAETFEAAVDLARRAAFGVEGAVEHVAHGAALVGENRSSIVTSSVIEKQSCTSVRLISSRGRVDAGLGVGALGGDAGGVEIAAVPAVALHLPAVGAGDLKRLEGHEIALAEAARDVGRRHDHGGGAVGDAAAIKQAERRGDGRRLQALLLGDRPCADAPSGS